MRPNSILNGMMNISNQQQQYIGHSEVEGIYWVPGFLHECHDAFHTNLTKKNILGCSTKGKSSTFRQYLVL